MPFGRILCRIYPTEDERLLLHILQQLFPEIEFRREGEWFKGEGDINGFLHMVARLGVIPRFIEVVKERKRGKHALIPIDREAAAAGQLSFSEEESEFSPIWLELPDPMDVIAYLQRLLPHDLLSGGSDDQ